MTKYQNRGQRYPKEVGAGGTALGIDGKAFDVDKVENVVAPLATAGIRLQARNSYKTVKQRYITTETIILRKKNKIIRGNEGGKGVEPSLTMASSAC